MVVAWSTGGGWSRLRTGDDLTPAFDALGRALYRSQPVTMQIMDTLGDIVAELEYGGERLSASVQSEWVDDFRDIVSRQLKVEY